MRTTAAHRDEYLAQPAAGERLDAADARRLAQASDRGDGRGPAARLQIVVSDGLNANAVNEQLRALLPPLRRALTETTSRAAADVIVRNGRVRAGYEIGELVAADVVVHVIGERPGTGLNTLSAYLTWGRDPSGRERWGRQLDHSATTAICGIHPRGKPPQTAAVEIARTVARIVEQQRSGVALR